MSGQQQQKFSTTPTRYADVGTMAEAPSVKTNLYKPTEARYTNDGRALDAIGTALGQFFNAGQQALETVDRVNHQQDLVQIERENQALQKQAVTDQALGRPQDPEYADRHAYAGTYQVAAADAHAFELSESLRAHMAKLPLDGSVDLNKVARDFFKEQVGSGTGNPDYDARMLSQFSKSADQQIAAYQEASRATIMQNTTAEVVQQFTHRVLSREGITTPQFAEMRERIGNIVHGDTQMRDKVVMAAIAGAVQNDGQGVGVLRAMQDLGLDKSEPEYFNRISGEVLKRTNAVKTFDAGQAVQSWSMALAQEKARYPQGILPPARIAEYAQRAYAIDSVHGVGTGPFAALQHEWSRGIHKEAAVNLWSVAFDGGLDTHDSARVASAFGKAPSVVLSEHYDAAMSAKVAEVSPALAATRDGTGLVSPMKSDEAARDYARFILAGGPNGGHRAASQDTMSDTYKGEMGNPLIGRDPVAMERSFTFYNDLHKGGMTKEQLHRYFPSDQAENTFWAMQIMSQGDRGIKQIAKDLVDRPYDAKDIADVARTGHLDLAAVARRGGVAGRPEEIDKKITEARNTALLDSAERKKWFGNAPVAMDSNEAAQFDALLLDQFQLHKRTRGAINLDDAIKAVAGQTGKNIVVPGYDGALQAIRDPFNGAGRTRLHPLNEGRDHPLSTTKGYAPIYAPGVKMTNSLGGREDLVVTWAEDANTAHTAFPGKIAEGDKLFLERPNSLGLSKVKDGTGRAIQFMPGETVALWGGPVSHSLRFSTPSEAATITKAPMRLVHSGGPGSTVVPTDPAEAAEFFKKNLGPGWYVQQDGFDGPQGRGYTLYYGARLKFGQNERDAQIEQRGRRAMQHRKDAEGMTTTVDTDGGAAIRYTHATGSAKAAAGSGNVEDPLTRLGQDIASGATTAAAAYKAVTRQQIDVTKTVGRAISRRLDNAAGAFKSDE